MGDPIDPIERRPAIFQIGEVRDDGHTVAVRGWGFTYCLPQCPCHRPHGSANPGDLHLHEDLVRGTIGLRSFASPPGCDCCRPWRFSELRDVTRFLTSLDSLPLTPDPPLPSLPA